MCTRMLLLGGALALLSGVGSAVGEDGRVEVEFLSPEKYTDARLDDGFRKGASKGVTEGLEKYLRKRAPDHLQAGQRLHVEFVDIDLAGDYEPTTQIALHDVRIVKRIYPPRLVFRWELKDSQGGTLRAGEEDLRDLGFQDRGGGYDRDPLRYETHMLRRWLQDTFPRGS
ncbi:DUF3016 domain-containing protein [Pseudomarimonas salicorniae]|uniref:DUF3016 domain-containing protein n=1 Tax=Pseudomarimonas salicorniae TaxID=2933270 RepID=A0ABT0GF97_9GAMM|nr:DUF3016 domain-containing protein [Lysobacter sp. CAU 1642]MCK7593215.1 DUF3016 domain-containing protein [Lysobacter sp. CAU 1642]